jgi:hypothetical protein
LAAEIRHHRHLLRGRRERPGASAAHESDQARSLIGSGHGMSHFRHLFFLSDGRALILTQIMSIDGKYERELMRACHTFRKSANG